jgi:putative restriction endonuclease
VTGRALPPAVATRLEKVAVDNGFDVDLGRVGPWLSFGSTQAPLHIWLTAPDDLLCAVALSMAHVASDLEEFGDLIGPPLPDGAAGARAVAGFAELHRLVRRAFQLSRTLPDALLHRFETQTAGLPRATEVERLVVQRLGQEVFRQGLLEYWQGRCAVTRLAVPELLRASHIKPWAACETDAERLDVFNGLLLAPHFDAAFDQGFITVGDNGEIAVSSRLDPVACRALGLDTPLRVEGLKAEHLRYLAFHRSQVFGDAGAGAAKPAANHTAALRPTSQAALRFGRYIGIDYSGAKTPTSGLRGLRVFVATPDEPAKEMRPSSGHWSRRDVAEWLIEQLSAGPATIVGIDHAFSFPLDYFSRHGLPTNWGNFLDDFHQHWPTDRDGVWVRDLRKDPKAAASARRGEITWRRLTEQRAGGAKSVFQFGVHGEVATSTHAGLPWLRHMRAQLRGRVHFWPFDGWEVPLGRSVMAEVYPALWRAQFPLAEASGDQQDAYAVAAWLQDADMRDILQSALGTSPSDAEREISTIEGWILGVKRSAL